MVEEMQHANREVEALWSHVNSSIVKHVLRIDSEFRDCFLGMNMHKRCEISRCWSVANGFPSPYEQPYLKGHTRGLGDRGARVRFGARVGELFDLPLQRGGAGVDRFVSVFARE